MLQRNLVFLLLMRTLVQGVDRCPTGVISLGKFAGSLADQAVENGIYQAPWDEDSGQRSDRHGYIYGRL